MGYVAFALATVGFAVGVKFRLQVLLPILVALLLASIVFSLFRASSVLDAALTVIVAQAVVQVSYFLGVVVQAVLPAIARGSHTGNGKPVTKSERKSHWERSQAP